MNQALNAELKVIANKIKNGDFLNIPLLSRPDVEKLTFFHIANIYSEINGLKQLIDELIEE